MAREHIFKTNYGAILGFGVELEMGLEPNVECLRVLTSDYGFDDSEVGHQTRPRDVISFPGGGRDNNRKGIHGFLADCLEHFGFTADVGDVFNRQYGLWQVDDDDTVMENGKTCSVLSRSNIFAALTGSSQLDRVEVVSPILGHPTDEPDASSWNDKLETLFAIIEGSFHIIDMSFASTHIHVGTMDRPWSQAEIVSIGEGINLISDIIPVFPGLGDTDRTDKWAKMNPQGAFNASSSIRSVVQSFCPHRSVAWNLLPMFGDLNDRPAKDTIEFRRPPQSKSAGEAKRYITITLCLVVLFLEKNELVATLGSEADSGSERKLLLLYNLLDRTASRFGLEGTI
jgi:hypothetical protein